MESQSLIIQDFHAVIEGIKRKTNLTSDRVWERINIRPELDFRFPRLDISLFEYDPKNNKYEMEVTFLGMYGVSSPLPAHYTRYLLETCNYDKDNTSISRDFLDILNKVIYEKYYLIEHKKYFGIRYWKEENKIWRQIFKSLSGDISIDEDCFDLYLLGILSHRVQSKYHIVRLLQKILKKKLINIFENIESIYILKRDECNQLGKKSNILAEDLYLGRKKLVRNSKIAIEITIRDTQEIEKYLTSSNRYGENLELVIKSTDNYLKDNLDYEVVLKVTGDVLSKTILGVKGNKLGVNSITGKATANKDYKLKIYDSELRGVVND